MTLDLSTLFEEGISIVKYEDIRRELEAVAAGSKALSFFQFPSLSVETHPFYTELRQIAFELDLYTVIIPVNETDPNPRLRVANVFLTKPNELWRIPAFSAFKNVFEDYKWSDAAEHFESALLGYSQDDISNWLKTRSRSQISWRGQTIYFLLKSTDAAGIHALANRCIDPRLNSESILSFFNHNQNPMRKDACDLVLDDCVLARVSVCQPFFREIFGRQKSIPDSDIATCLLNSETISKMNASLESNFQFLSDGTWK